MIIRRREFTRPVRKKKAVAYCRVSTTEQEESYETQYAVYKRMIENNPDLEFAGIYSDLGKSGTSSEHRDGFKHMIRDAEKRKIEVIYVKSISRFARNVGDCQRYVDKLRELGVVVIFERENIRTDDPTSNFALALIGAVSQDESHSISKNVSMGYHERFSRGVFNLGNNRILGYDTKDGKLVPNGDAWIVKEIFDRFISGESITGIATAMNAKGARTIRGKDFTNTAVKYILKNETYAGDKLLQKQTPVDYITHKPDPNEYAPSYYLKDDHEAVISRDVWEEAQKRLEERETAYRNGDTAIGTAHHALYKKIYCGECGAFFSRRTFKKRDGTHYKSWICSERQNGKNGNGCKCRSIREETLIEEINGKFGWEEFKEELVLEKIDRVIIYPDRISILVKPET